jgi:hypothetical protein
MISIYRRVQRLAKVAVAVVSVTLLSTAQAGRIPAGLYYLETVPTGTSFNFSNDSIPSGFFGPGSDAFIGFFRLRGIPFHETTADTVVRRLSDFNITQNGKNEAPVTISIQIEMLSLASVNPITVTYNQGQNPELWDVRVSLSPNQQQLVGSMTISETNPQGGTYDVRLPVRMVITFTRQSDDATRALPMSVLFGDNNVPWSHNAGRVLLTDHQFCPICIEGESRVSTLVAPGGLQWQVQPALGP